MIRKIFTVTLVILILMATPVQAGPGLTSVADISDELVCQCGCSMILSNCSHQECGSRNDMTAFVASELERGQTGAQIISTFVTQNGERVLSAPPKKGIEPMLDGMALKILSDWYRIQSVMAV